jgi:hypothetical protein
VDVSILLLRQFLLLLLLLLLILLLLQMNVSALEGELSRAMALKADTSGALSAAVAAKVAAEQRLNSILVSYLYYSIPITLPWQQHGCVLTGNAT